MIDYLRNYLDTKTINDYEKADIILNVFFTCINLLLIALTLTIFSKSNKDITDLSYQLVGIFFVDIIIRLYHIYLLQTEISNVLLKEIIYCLFGADLLYLTLSIKNQISKILKIKGKIDIILPCVLYVILFFSYDKIISFYPFSLKSYMISFSNLLLLTQTMFNIIYIYYIFAILRPGVESIANTLIKEERIINIVNKFIIGAPYSCLFLFILHYLIKICLLFSNYPIMILYGNIALNIFKDGAKYFAFITCEIIVYAMSIQIVKENKRKSDGDEIQIINM